MSSILTNTSAMTALKTLRGVAKGLEGAQKQISTGKRVAGADDNPSIWSVSALMKSDVTGFRAIQDSLSLGAATLRVGSDGAATVRELLSELRQRVVAAAEDNIDRAKVDADVQQLKQQIIATVDASQFNGLNLLKHPRFSTDSQINFVASLNRSNGGLEASRIYVDRQNLSGQPGELVGGVLAAGTGGVDSTAASAYAFESPADDGATAYAAMAASPGPGNTTDIQFSEPLPSGKNVVLNVTVGTSLASIEIPAGTTPEAAAAMLAAKITEVAADEGVSVAVLASPADETVRITNTGAEAKVVKSRASDESTGAFFALWDMNVLTKADAARALQDIEAMLEATVNAGAEFGAAEKRIEVSETFVSRVADSLTTGVGAISDTDMEAASARLQALQVQQQLGVQALSIANQQPQTILALFQGGG